MSRSAFAAIVGLSTLMIGGCGAPLVPDQDVLTLEVAPFTVECTGEMVQRCLRVRRAPDEEWTNFYDPIDGFTHEEGYHYHIQVARRRVPNPPADASSYEYRLLRIISKEPA